MKAVSSKYTEMVRFLIDAGADVNYADNYGFTALMIAAEVGHTQIVEMLIEHGADVNYATNHGTTALELAADSGHIDEDIVRVLIGQ